MSRQEKGFYEFGPFRLDPVKRALHCGDDPVALTPKAFSTLLALVERQGEVVEKDTLIELVWPDTFITEATLTQNVFRLRKALGEGAGDHRFIVTVPGRGYSFVAEVRRIDPPAPLADPPEEVFSEEPEPADLEAMSTAEREAVAQMPGSPIASAGRSPWAAGLAVGLTLLALSLLLLRAGPRSAPHPPAVQAASAASPRRS
ncbi:MAG TPA: transcriptional regulator, partial [Thermoanaerobaculia bacterium]